MTTRSPWTQERRARQAEIIRCTKPWQHSTGPRTPEGKAQSSRNAMLMRNDSEARRAFDLTHQFLSTGIVPPALGELWLAAYLNPVGDKFTNDLLGFANGSDAPLPALRELWLAADLNPSVDEFCCNDLLGFANGGGDAPLDDGAIADLLDFTLDYLPDDGDGNAWLFDIDLHGDDT